MNNAKNTSTPLPSLLQLSSNQSPNTKEYEYMSQVPYSATVGSIMYSMVSTRLDLAYSISILKTYMSNQGDKDSRKSTISYVFMISRKCVSLKSQLQPMINLSTMEVEHVAATEAIKEALWIQGEEVGVRESNSCQFIALLQKNKKIYSNFCFDNELEKTHEFERWRSGWVLGSSDGDAAEEW
ncbi:secreted RxLR effector protein 161-like [Humulus lupulus]|uniref:secreted RxLR effector protein 161-like n=1 Tax=Humulus lupulus TaxID=3486 RepID=UPI002B4104E2|nr:secreted RxLR effector protein 161-like [Humulus lupulus]